MFPINFQEKIKPQPKKDIDQALQAASNYFRNSLESRYGSQGIKYLEQRGIKNEQIEEFGLGLSLGGINTLVDHLKHKKFNDVKKWVNQNLDNDPISIMRKLYDNSSKVMDGPSIAAAVLIIADYQYKSAFVVDQEINLVAALTEIMMGSEFK